MPIRRCHLRLVLALAVALGTAPLVVAADAPTKDEWAPVVQAIAEQAPDAGQQLTAITTKYPKWAGGWIELARYNLAERQPEDAWKHARQALTLERTNGEAGALAVQALTLVGRHDHAITVGEPFRANRQDDKQAGGRAGWVNFYAAQAALTAKTPDPAKAEDLLKTAKACAGAAVPGEFHFLDAKLAIRRADHVGGVKSLERAVTADPALWDAWYELGRVRGALVDRETSVPGKRQLLLAAEQAFLTVTKALPDDFESWLGLGRAQSALAQLDIDSRGEGGAKLKDAVASFTEALQRKPDLVPALAAMGEAQLRLERYALAAEALTKARELGANDDVLLSNLALALEKSGRTDEAVKVQAGATATTAPALINKGMILFKAKVYRNAIDLFERAAKRPDLEAQPETRGQVLRFTGHAWRDWAAAPAPKGPETTETVPKGTETVPTGAETAPAASDDLREQRLDQAADAYQRAGDLGDTTAIRHYAALQSERGPHLAYAAGWKLLGWSAYSSFTGWKLVLGNYGTSRAWNSALHLGIWGVLAGLPLLLWIASMFRRAPVAADGTRRPTTRKVPTDHQRPEPSAPRTEREMNPVTARVKARQALEPRASASRPRSAASAAKPLATPRPTPPAAKHVETDPVPKRQASPAPAVRKTPLPETDEFEPPPDAPAKRTRPR